jgi:hypothetical protein
MKLLQFAAAILATALFSSSASARVYKCTGELGETKYQSSPCVEANKVSEINMQTGGLTDLSIRQKKQKLVDELQKQQMADAQKKIELEEKRIKSSKKQSELNQQLIRNNPIRFSAFAIPPYAPDELTELVKEFEARLPEIEKFRRLAALKALSTGECKRVEGDELSVKSKADELVFSVDCSSAMTFQYSESELIEAKR